MIARLAEHSHLPAGPRSGVRRPPPGLDRRPAGLLRRLPPARARHRPRPVADHVAGRRGARRRRTRAGRPAGPRRRSPEPADPADRPPRPGRRGLLTGPTTKEVTMSFASPLHRTLLIALASLALSAPAALARPADLRSEAPTSSLSGTTDQTSAEATPGRVLRRSFDPYPEPVSRREAALAQERSYSTYGEPAPQPGGDDRRHRLRRRDRVCAVRSRPRRCPGRRAGRRKRAAGPPPRHPAGDLNSSRTSSPRARSGGPSSHAAQRPVGRCAAPRV